MIYPKVQISKRWYYTSVPDENVLEIYTGKPIGVETTCDGFDLRKSVTKDNVEYYNPKYGMRLEDTDAKKIFPHVNVNYNRYKMIDGVKTYMGKTVKGYINVNTGKPIYDENGEYDLSDNARRSVIPLIRVDGAESTSVTYKVYNTPIYDYDTTDQADAKVFSEVYWLDTMVSEGDACPKNEVEYENGLVGLEPKIDDTHVFRNVDTSIEGEESQAYIYGYEYRDFLVDYLMEGIEGGLPFIQARLRLPWYATGSRTNVDGSVDEVTGSAVYSPGEEHGTNLNSLFRYNEETGAISGTLKGFIAQRLNEMANDCFEDIYDDIVKGDVLEGCIQYEECEPFQTITSINGPEPEPDEEEELIYPTPSYGDEEEGNAEEGGENNGNG